MSSPGTDAAPVRSMTGYAQVRKQAVAGELTVSLRSVNHRGLDLHFYQSNEFAPFEAAMRALLKEQVGRGHLEIRVSLAREGAVAGTSTLNLEALKRYAEAFRQAAAELELTGKPDLNVLLSMPGVLGSAAEAKPLDRTFEGELLPALAETVGALNACREREGRELVVSVVHELTEIESSVGQIADLRMQVLPHLHSSLREKLTELLTNANLSEGRLAEEAAILADRSDIHEELTRLAVHAQEMRRILAKGGQVGKTLDFLLQEMNRETNTTLSKSSNAGEPGLKITRLALDVKANIERIREQALNLE